MGLDPVIGSLSALFINPFPYRTSMAFMALDVTWCLFWIPAARAFSCGADVSVARHPFDTYIGLALKLNLFFKTICFVRFLFFLFSEPEVLGCCEVCCRHKANKPDMSHQLSEIRLFIFRVWKPASQTIGSRNVSCHCSLMPETISHCHRNATV